MCKYNRLFFLTLIIFTLVLLPYIGNVSCEKATGKITELLITSDFRLGYVGGFVNKNDFHFLVISQYNEHSYLVQYLANEEIVLVENQIGMDKFFVDTIMVDKQYLTFSSNQMVYLIYIVDEWNETALLFNHKYVCYYYNLLTASWGEFLVMDVTELENLNLVGVNRANNKGVFLITNTRYELNETDVSIITIEGDTNLKKQNKTEPFALWYALSCFVEEENCAYFLFADSNYDYNYHFYQYNCTSEELTLLANCTINIEPDSTLYDWPGGRLLYDVYTDSFYILTGILGSYVNYEISLFKLNNTNFVFNMVNTTNNPHAVYAENFQGQLYFGATNDIFDTYLMNGEIKLLIRVMKDSHSKLVNLCLCSNNLSSEAEWIQTTIESEELEKCFYSSFLFNLTAGEYLETYLTCYKQQDSFYHTTTQNKNIFSISLYGTLFENTKPHLLRVMVSSNYWLMIFGPTSVTIVAGGFGGYFIIHHRKIRKLQEKAIKEKT